MRCVFILLHPSFSFDGGSTRVATAHMATLRAHGHEVLEVSFGKDDRLTLSTDGQRFHRVGPPRMGLWRKALVLRRILPRLARRSTLLACHFHPYLVLTRVAALSDSVVLHFHGPWAEERRVEGTSRLAFLVQSALERRVLSAAGHIVVLSEAFRLLVETLAPKARGKTSVLPGSVDIGYWTPPLPVEKGDYILIVRRLVPRTGVLNLVNDLTVESAAALGRKVIIVGGGPQKVDILAAIERRNLSPWIEVRGFVEEASLLDLYHRAYATLLPTIAWEGFGMSALESLAAGTPVLATPVGGLQSLLGRFDETLLCPSGEAFGHFMVRRLAHPLPSAAACTEYAAGFSAERLGSQLLALYQKIGASA